MTHHVHLLLTARKAAAVPRLVMILGRRYVQYINRTYQRTGSLWDSRYKSSAVQAETELGWTPFFFTDGLVSAVMWIKTRQ